MKVIAGLDSEYEGQALLHPGVKVGYLPQEPELDPTKTVKENIFDGVAEKLEILSKYNEVIITY